MDKDEKKIRYLEFIENIISRMADCSFRCKEFCVLIITGLLAVYASLDNHPESIILCCLAPICIFWIMDSFYLYKEKLYRKLYEDNKNVSNEADEIKEFSLKANSDNILEFLKKYLASMFLSISTVVLYGLLIVSTICFYFIMKGVN